MSSGSALRKRFVSKPWRTYDAGHGRGVDNVTAFTVSANVGKERTDAVKHSHKVHVEHPSPIFERNVVDASEAADTRIVANYMDVAECLVRCLGRTLDAMRIGNVTGNAAHIRSKFVEIFDSNR